MYDAQREAAVTADPLTPVYPTSGAHLSTLIVALRLCPATSASRIIAGRPVRVNSHRERGITRERKRKKFEFPDNDESESLSFHLVRTVSASIVRPNRGDVCVQRQC